ncbi:putative Cathepsin B [Blattamonas nauphoetae]|uniref:Cathepsin B n=1 Tax=Blattamonas nauphoetae TaxID=2049346 RepID=A0ABQ9XPJ3_9EUKA|nr:putative Cathepsin B [Blattamonas nauphoetae]
MFVFILANLIQAAAYVDPSIVDTVNKNHLATWKARDYRGTRFSPAKVVKSLDKTILPEDQLDFVAPITTPSSYDIREAYPDYILPIYNQDECGGCWAFTTAGVMSIRRGIAGCWSGPLSMQDLISCDSTNSACKSGHPFRAQQWARNMGMTTYDCLPFVSASGRVPTCPTKCRNGSEIERFKWDNILSLRVGQVQDSLLTDGPLYARLNIYEDFLSYSSGVYQHLTGDLYGSHAVILLGWGEENGVKFWVLQNSWGADWGEKRYFRIRMGKNEAGIERAFYGGTVVC